MKAMILAAGLGTRLQPLTDNKPKALVEINGKPMIEHLIEKMKMQGFTEIVVNVHYFGDLLIDFLQQKNNFGINILISDERNQLLDTGGGLKQARCFLENDEPFILHNVDIFSDIDLKKLLDIHLEYRALSSLCVYNGTSNRRLQFDSQNQLCAWENKQTGELKIARPPQGQLNSYSFMGIHIIDPSIFRYITEKGSFSIIDMYLRLAEKHSIKSTVPEFSYWFDLGKPDDIHKAETLLKMR
jgi:NDP-sugar pyrophosphorylase family protein